MSKLTKEQRELYESDIKAKSDWNGGMNWAKKQAAEQAAKESAQQTALKFAREMLADHQPIDKIVKYTKLQ